ncbi:hypothetical protein AZK46_15645 [Acinetobacter baumannii]|nr:hypothetical protein AZK46_15645 [Acinetobacter baumannii]
MDSIIMKFALFYFSSMLTLYVIAFPLLFLSEMGVAETTAIWFFSVTICFPLAIHAKKALIKI